MLTLLTPSFTAPYLDSTLVVRVEDPHGNYLSSKALDGAGYSPGKLVAGLEDKGAREEGECD